MRNKTIFITGGTGSFGNAFVEYCLNYIKPKKIIIFSRDELKQYEMEKKYNKNHKTQLRFFIGDVRDLERLKLAMRNADLVIHAAALKQVPTAEYNPIEAIKTNILGAQNIIDAALSLNIDKILALSTDKAAAPINLYGATKLASDKLMIAANNLAGDKISKFSVVRYGNVMESRGSVVPLFYKQSKMGFFNITHREMTRFNITLAQSVEYVFECLEKMVGGELFVPKLPSYKIIDLARAINSKAKIKIIGIRPGEKIHEELITRGDSINCKEFKKEYIIFPNSIFINNNRYKKYKMGRQCNFNFSYASNNNKDLLNVIQIRKLLKK